MTYSNSSTSTATATYTNDSTYTNTTDLIWTAWNSSCTITSCTPSSNDIAIWTAWNNQYRLTYPITSATTTTFTTNNTVWTAWNQQFTTAPIGRIYPGRAVSQEERDKWKLQEEEDRRKYEKIERERLEANGKAEVLLLRHLTDKQKEDLRTKNFFDIDVEGIQYRIKRGSHGNVHMLGKRDEISKSFCIQPKDCPEGDAMLAQKLLLETNPENFWKQANVTDMLNGRRTISRADNVIEFRRAHKKDVA